MQQHQQRFPRPALDDDPLLCVLNPSPPHTQPPLAQDNSVPPTLCPTSVPPTLCPTSVPGNIPREAQHYQLSQQLLFNSSMQPSDMTTDDLHAQLMLLCQVPNILPSLASASAPAPYPAFLGPRPAQCSGLQYANLLKERAREEYKDRRRLELLGQGQVDRVKRRRKNDNSMSEHQKYSRRLKMNQDSAAAARFAQDVYVHALEQLVVKGDEEKRSLTEEIDQLRAERDRLACIVDRFHTRNVHNVLALPDEAATTTPIDEDVLPDEISAEFLKDLQDEPPLNLEDPCSAPMLRKIFELLEIPETASALQSDPSLSCGTYGIFPTRAV